MAVSGCRVHPVNQLLEVPHKGCRPPALHPGSSQAPLPPMLASPVPTGMLVPWLLKAWDGARQGGGLGGEAGHMPPHGVGSRVEVQEKPRL